MSQDIRDAGNSTGSRLIVLEPPGQRLAGPSGARRPPNLSPREWELVQGLMSHQRLTTVAPALGISVYTARNHLKAVFRKMNVHSQHELLRLLAESRDDRSPGPSS